MDVEDGRVMQEQLPRDACYDAAAMVLRDIMSPKKHPIAWLALVFIVIILLAAWIVPQAA
jgi:hypothetical protein